MFIRRALSLVVAILWLWPASLHAQSEALLEAHRQGEAFYEAGQYDRAIPFFRKALEIGERELGSNHLTTATLINNLAMLYNYQGRYADTEPLLKRSLAILEKALGPGHPDVAQSLENYAALLRKTGHGVEATKMEARAKAIRAKHAKENP